MDEEFREIEVIDTLGNEYHYFNVEYFWNKDNTFELIDQKKVLHHFNPDRIIKYSIIKLKEQINKKDYVMVNGEQESQEDKEGFNNFIQNYFDCEEEKL
jgi:hypothetical protein